MGRRILFFDVDGTIVTREHVIPESARQALAAAKRAGHVLLVNTGRPYLHVEPQIKALPMSGFLCALGGHILLEGEEVFHSSFSPEESRRVRDLGYECGLDMLFESEKGVWFDARCRNPYGEKEFRWLTGIGVPGCRDTARPEFVFDKFVCWPREGGDPGRFTRTLEDRLTFIPRENGMLEAVRRGLSKAGAMSLVTERLGAKPEDTFAFGDGANDLPMLRAAGTSVLLGNAPRELWPEADYVSAPIEEDGLARALEHFGLI